jgi:hypothetical protein
VDENFQVACEVRRARSLFLLVGKAKCTSACSDETFGATLRRDRETTYDMQKKRGVKERKKEKVRSFNGRLSGRQELAKDCPKRDKKRRKVAGGPVRSRKERPTKP